jgi:hypothetical protein
MQQTDVKAAHFTGTAATMYTGRTRLKGMLFLGDGTAGDMILRDGGSSGTVRLQFNVPANSNNDVAVTIPGEGILFNTSIHITMPGTLASMTIFYG